jgi:hypothetical protein
MFFGTVKTRQGRYHIDFEARTTAGCEEAHVMCKPSVKILLAGGKTTVCRIVDVSSNYFVVRRCTNVIGPWFLRHMPDQISPPSSFAHWVREKRIFEYLSIIPSLEAGAKKIIYRVYEQTHDGREYSGWVCYIQGRTDR